MKLEGREESRGAGMARLARWSLTLGLLLVVTAGGLYLHLTTARLTARLEVVEQEVHLLRSFVRDPQVLVSSLPAPRLT